MKRKFFKKKQVDLALIKQYIRNNDIDELIKIITTSDFDINKTDATGQTLLHFAFSGNHYKSVAVLLEYGADPFFPNSNGISVYNSALKVGSSLSKQILMDQIKEISFLVRFNQNKIIQDKLTKNEIVVSEELIHYCLENKKYTLLKLCIEKNAEEFDNYICDHYLKIFDTDLFQNIIKNSRLIKNVKEKIPELLFSEDENLSEKQINFIIECGILDDYCFHDFLKIKNKKIIEKYYNMTEKWRGLKLSNNFSLNFQHLDLLDALETGFKYGVELHFSNLSDMIITNDHVLIKIYFILGLQFGVLTNYIGNIQKENFIDLLQDEIKEKIIFHRKSGSKWVKYRFKESNNELITFVPVKELKNSFTLQYSIVNLLENYTKNYFPKEDSPIALRSSSINIKQHNFVKQCWDISPLLLQLSISKVSLPLIIYSEINYKKYYNEITVEIDNITYKLSDIFPFRKVNTESFEQEVDSSYIEPGFSIILNSSEYDCLNYIINTKIDLHILELDISNQNKDKVRNLLQWSCSNENIVNRLYRIETGTFCNYYYPGLVPSTQDRDWKLFFFDTGIEQFVKKKVKISQVPDSILADIDNFLLNNISDENQEIINDFRYKYYYSTGNDRVYSSSKEYLNFPIIKEVLDVFDDNNFEIIDDRFPIINSVISQNNDQKIIVGTILTGKSLQNKLGDETIKMLTQGARCLRYWFHSPSTLLLTYWSGCKSIRLLSSRICFNIITVFYEKEIGYLEKYFELLQKIEHFFLNKKSSTLSDFNLTFKQPLITYIYQEKIIKNTENVVDNVEKKILLEECYSKSDSSESECTDISDRMLYKKIPVLLDNGKVCFFNETDKVYSIDYQKERYFHELEEDDMIVIFEHNGKIFIDLSDIILEIGAIRKFYERTQQWRKIIDKKIEETDNAVVFLEICKNIQNINELTFKNWINMKHYQIGPRDQSSHKKIYECFSSRYSERKVSNEWKNITAFRLFKLILGNKVSRRLSGVEDTREENIINEEIIEAFWKDEDELNEINQKLFKIFQSAKKVTILKIGIF